MGRNPIVDWNDVLKGPHQPHLVYVNQLELLFLVTVITINCWVNRMAWKLEDNWYIMLEGNT
jgi:hypothetical protein